MLRLARYAVSQFRPRIEHFRCYSVELPNTSESQPDNEKRRKVIELEIDIMRQEGRKVPSELSPSEMERLLILPSVSARRRYMSFLFGCEMKTINQKKKKEQRQAERLEILAQQRELEKDKEIVYGLGRNSYFLKIYETTMNKWHNNKLTRAMQFSQKLVIDCSYDEHMTIREADNCAKQLCYTFAMNRLHDQPFDLHYCNLDTENTISGKKLLNHIPTMYNPDFPMNAHKQSFVDLFEKEKLVYLTPHCGNVLLDYNHDDIFIIGAMVNKAHDEPISLAKAKKLGLRMAKLPLDKYLRWGIGGKSLTIDQMVKIMLEMRDKNDWEQALSFVPRRKLFNENLQQSHKLKSAQYFRPMAKGKVTVSRTMLDDEEDDYRSPERRQNDFRSFDERRQQQYNPKSKERKHFEKYFDLDTWAGSSKKKKGSGQGNDR